MSFKYADNFPISRVFLHPQNPRHDPVENEAAAIAELCENEDVLVLARDIVAKGLNPLERFALVPAQVEGGKAAKGSYFVMEGNRRMCALKLLHDPDRAPAPQRGQFKKLAQGRSFPNTISAAIFDDAEEVRVWLERIHNGPQGGIGRLDWDAEQKERFYGRGKNRAALALLDYAERKKMISKTERAGKLTTVQRFIGNPDFRAVLGFEEAENNDGFKTSLARDEFDARLVAFIRALLDREQVTSRMNRDEIAKYAQNLGPRAPKPAPGAPSPGKKGNEEEQAGREAAKGRGTSRLRPLKPSLAKYVRHDDDVYAGLKKLKNEKLLSLYFSICKVELSPHAPLVAIGVWAFFESLSACAGRNDSTNFEAFLSSSRLQSYSIADAKAVRKALQRVAEYGNTTKHHRVSAAFNGEQINNDMSTLKAVLVGLIGDAQKAP